MGEEEYANKANGLKQAKEILESKSKKPKNEQRHTGLGSLGSHTSHPAAPHGASIQPSVKNMFPKVNAGTKDQLDKRVAAFFLENGVPFVKVESPSFLELVRDLCAYDGTYKPQSRRTLSGRLLDECEEEMNAKLKTVNMSRNNYSCTLVTDGWTLEHQGPYAELSDHPARWR